MVGMPKVRISAATPLAVETFTRGVPEARPHPAVCPPPDRRLHRTEVAVTVDGGFARQVGPARP
jgi:hypothetical protein